MRIGIVGPVHPYKGGIAQHTTQMAHAFAREGHDVVVESWRSQYPGILYKGEMTVPSGEPEVEVFPKVVRDLSWSRPASWVRAAARLSNADTVIFAVSNTYQVIPYLTMLPKLALANVQTVALTHNVLPHEAHSWDRAIMRRFFRRMSEVVVSSENQARLAAKLGAHNCFVLDLPPNIRESNSMSGSLYRVQKSAPLRLLFFGLIREYKGLDVLIRALPLVPDASLTIAGEFWDDRTKYEDLANRVGVGQRVQIRDGYIANDDIPELFSGSDAVVLPYRSVTGSGVPKIARAFGKPMVVSDVGVLPDIVRPGFGLVFRSEDANDLAEKLGQIREPAIYNPMVDSILSHSETFDGEWSRYVNAIEEGLSS